MVNPRRTPVPGEEGQMARTPPAQRVQDAYSVVSEARTREVGVERVLEERRTRREFLGDAGIAGAAVVGASAFGRLTNAAYGAAGTKVVVVGAGLAGLTCTYRLRQKGVIADLYEAHPTRVGGRCWSYRPNSRYTPYSFANGQIAEHGGELIDQGHTAFRHLIQELGFNTDNLLAGEPNGSEDWYWVNGHRYEYSRLVDDLNGIYQKMHKDVSAASYPTLWNSYTQRGWELDHMSIIQWLDETVPNGGSKSDLGRVLDIAYNIEYGAESSVQSSLNLLYLLGYSGQGQFRTFGPSNEKYHVTGGNDQIPWELARRLANQIHLGYELTAIARTASGGYTLTFANGLGTTTVAADHVVLAIPFSILRSAVNYKKAGFEPLKVTAIEELGMGTNSKLHVQFRDRFWYPANNGNTYADTGYQNTWEVTRSQPGSTGILVDYTGGNIGASFGVGTPADRAQDFFTQIKPLFPDAASHWNGVATIDFWTGYEWTKGSYSYWKVGQYTKFSGMEKVRQGNCHFCGEHTSQDFQGYLNGGVETGERAAAEVLADLKK
jgi:monoamine oxidase